MARSRIDVTTNDLITDGGAVLWSLIKGEQLELSVTLDFIDDPNIGYTYEAVIVEGANVYGQQQRTRPTTIQTDGVQTVLTVRLPVNRGTWDADQAYNREEVVLYEGKYYKLLDGAARTSAIVPSLDPMWEATVLNRVYIQFPNTIGSDWAISPSVNSPVYGFFELRVTEPTNPIFTRTWKPVRGMVELLFSPTDIVPDGA